MSEFLSVISAVAAVGGTVGQFNQQKKSSELQQQQQTLQTRQSQRQAIREMQIKRAQAIAQAAISGAGDSSSLQGGLSSLSSQLGSGLGYASQQTQLSRGVTNANAQADLFGQIAKVGGYGVQKYGFPGFAPAPTPPPDTGP